MEQTASMPLKENASFPIPFRSHWFGAAAHPRRYAANIVYKVS
jgi:hypothetical protein